LIMVKELLHLARAARCMYVCSSVQSLKSECFVAGRLNDTDSGKNFGPDLPVLLKCTQFGQLILRRIIKVVAARCQILRLKCIKFNFGWGSAPDPAGRAYSAPPVK